MRALPSFPRAQPLWSVLTFLGASQRRSAWPGSGGSSGTGHEGAGRCFRRTVTAATVRTAPNEGGLNYILDRDKLVERKKIIPGCVPDKSRLFQTRDSPQRPHAACPDEKVRPGQGRTFRSCATGSRPALPAAGAPAPHARVPGAGRSAGPDFARTSIRSPEAQPALQRATSRSRTCTTPACPPTSCRVTVMPFPRLVNSLSWERPHRRAPAHRPGGHHPPPSTLRELRFGTRRYGRAVLAANPYGIEAELSAAQEIYKATQCRQPYVRADWFVAAASRPPLYHDVLRPAPRRWARLEKLLRLDAAENIRQEKVVRAGFNSFRRGRVITA